MVLLWRGLTLTSVFAGGAPLYPGASISFRESVSSIYDFSVSNKLTESATQQLLNLISNHCPSPNLCPQTVYKLKKEVGQFCSECMEPVPLNENHCSSQQCIDKEATVCHYALLSFEEQLKELFSG